MAKKRIIVDFDNTMGVPGCDVDDGLALLYLLGCDDAEIEGVCTTYGNSTLETVHATTERTLELYGLAAPLLRGMTAPLSMAGAEAAESAEDAGARSPIVADARTARALPDAAVMRAAAEAAEAPRFIADALVSAPDEVHILATGSTTNLGAAALLRPDALADAASITLMGGITRSLVINGRIMNELNLSCDPTATAAVLASGAPVTIAASHNCLPAFFTRDDLTSAFGEDSWLCRTCDYWFRTMDAAYAWRGWTCWDVVAAAYLMHPELFCDHPSAVTLDVRLLDAGYLELDNPDAPHALVNLPTIRDAAVFKEHVLGTWARGMRRAGLVD